MRTTERLLEQLNKAFGGEAWYGPALRNLLDDINEDAARQRPMDGAHSIFELVIHIRTWMDVVARRIARTDEVVTTVEDWSDIAGTSWSDTLEELEHAQSRLVDAVARLTTERLEQNVAGQSQKIYDEILGVIQHNVYHTGQIALLKRALRT